MRRSRLVTLLGGTLLAAFLLPSVALASDAAPRVTPTAPNIKLHCALVIPAGHPARERVVCGWSRRRRASTSAPTACGGSSTRGLGRPRQLVARVAPDKPLRAVDREHPARPPYTYRVVAIGTDGSRVGISNRVWLRVGWPAEKLAPQLRVRDRRRPPGRRLPLGRRPIARAPCGTCSSARSTAARGERIYRTGDHGRRSFFDTRRRGRPDDPLQGVRARPPTAGSWASAARQRRRPDHRHAHREVAIIRRRRHRHTCRGGRSCGCRRR